MLSPRLFSGQHWSSVKMQVEVLEKWQKGRVQVLGKAWKGCSSRIHRKASEWLFLCKGGIEASWVPWMFFYKPFIFLFYFLFFLLQDQWNSRRPCWVFPEAFSKTDHSCLQPFTPASQVQSLHRHSGPFFIGACCLASHGWSHFLCLLQLQKSWRKWVRTWEHRQGLSTEDLVWENGIWFSRCVWYRNHGLGRGAKLTVSSVTSPSFWALPLGDGDLVASSLSQGLLVSLLIGGGTMLT